MTASEARLEAARIWLMAAESAGLAVTMVGDRVYCGARIPDPTVKALLGNVADHKPALAVIFADEDGETRFRKARAMYPGPKNGSSIQ